MFSWELFEIYMTAWISLCRNTFKQSLLKMPKTLLGFFPIWKTIIFRKTYTSFFFFLKLYNLDWFWQFWGKLSNENTNLSCLSQPKPSQGSWLRLSPYIITEKQTTSSTCILDIFYLQFKIKCCAEYSNISAS